MKHICWTASLFLAQVSAFGSYLFTAQTHLCTCDVLCCLICKNKLWRNATNESDGTSELALCSTAWAMKWGISPVSSSCMNMLQADSSRMTNAALFWNLKIFSGVLHRRLQWAGSESVPISSIAESTFQISWQKSLAHGLRAQKKFKIH